jgi:hypothetical protein
MGGADVEGVDVKAAAAEETGDARQDAEAVLDQDGDGVAHRADRLSKKGGGVTPKKPRE